MHLEIRHIKIPEEEAEVKGLFWLARFIKIPGASLIDCTAAYCTRVSFPKKRNISLFIGI